MKNTRSAARATFFVLSIFIVNGILIFAIVTRNNPPFSVADILMLLFVNILLIGTWLYTRTKKFRENEFKHRLDRDLKLKNMNAFSIGVAKCPNCQKRTISTMHAIRLPQTCGECGRRFKVIPIKFEKLAFFFVLVLISYLTFNLLLNGILNKDGALLLYAVLFFALNYCMLRLRKITEVE